MSSLRRALAITGERSVRTAVRCRRSEIPPKRATSGFLPSSRLTMTWKHLRGPFGVSIIVLYFRDILATVEWCFAAKVFSIEVSMAHRSLPRRYTSWARK